MMLILDRPADAIFRLMTGNPLPDSWGTDAVYKSFMKYYSLSVLIFVSLSADVAKWKLDNFFI